MANREFAHPDITWACFHYLMLKRASWLTRRVETWTYAGDAQWCRAFSYDLNTSQLNAIWNEAQKIVSEKGHLLSSDEDDETPSVTPIPSSPTEGGQDTYSDGNPLINEPYCVPLFDVSKRQQFTDFDLRDEKGCSLHLLMRKISAQVTLNALIGAMLVEHSDSKELLLRFDEPTTSFLWELFSNTVAPSAQNGRYPMSGSEIITKF